MEWSLLSPSGSPAEQIPHPILFVEDEQFNFFPPSPIPGAMEMFKPLLDAMKVCIGNRPVALATEVKQTLQKAHPNAISSLQLISFAEYFSLARQRGVSIRCSQSLGKPILMWFSFYEVIEKSAITQVTQNKIVERLTAQASDTQSLSNSDCTVDKLDSALSKANSYAGGEFLNNAENTKVNCCFGDTWDQMETVPVIVPETLKPDNEENFQVVSPSSKKKKKSIEDQVTTILTTMKKVSYRFCYDQALFKFVEILVKFVFLHPDSGSIVSANWVYKFIQRHFPSYLGSSSDSNSMRDKAYSAILSRSNHQEWQMPIVFVRRRFEIDIGKLRRLVAIYKEDS